MCTPKFDTITRAKLSVHQKMNSAILFSQNKEKILPFTTTGMALEVNMHSEITQAQKDKYQVISLSSQK